MYTWYLLQSETEEGVKACTDSHGLPSICARPTNLAFYPHHTPPHHSTPHHTLSSPYKPTQQSSNWVLRGTKAISATTVTTAQACFNKMDHLGENGSRVTFHAMTTMYTAYRAKKAPAPAEGEGQGGGAGGGAGESLPPSTRRAQETLQQWCAQNVGHTHNSIYGIAERGTEMVLTNMHCVVLFFIDHAHNPQPKRGNASHVQAELVL